MAVVVDSDVRVHGNHAAFKGIDPSTVDHRTSWDTGPALWNVVLEGRANLEFGGVGSMSERHRDVVLLVVRLDPKTVLVVKYKRTVRPRNLLICVKKGPVIFKRSTLIIITITSWLPVVPPRGELIVTIYISVIIHM